jgi:hypothetical protein
MKNLAVLLGLMLSFGNSMADYQHCNSLLQHGITNISKAKSTSHATAFKWHKYCGSDITKSSDSYAAEAGLSIFGIGGASAGGNSSALKEKIKQWCDQNSTFAQSKQSMYEESRMISDSALDAWNQCQETSKKGINITTSIQGEFDKYVDFSIDSTSDGTHLFYGASVEGYTCTIELSNGAITETDEIAKSTSEKLILVKQRPKIDNKNIHISCRRNDPQVSEVKGIGTIKYQQGHITVMTSGPALPVSFPAVVSSYHVTPPKAVMAFASEMCPDGWRPYEKAFGRFIRGVDFAAKTDPDGKRDIGTWQEDGLRSHTHPYNDVYFMEAWGDKNTDLGQNRAGNRGNHDTDNEPYQIGRTTSATGDSETRPKNVALLYCEKI